MEQKREIEIIGVPNDNRAVIAAKVPKLSRDRRMLIEKALEAADLVGHVSLEGEISVRVGERAKTLVREPATETETKFRKFLDGLGITNSPEEDGHQAA